MFTTFRNPSAVTMVGLDNYIMTDRAAMVAAAAGISLSTSVTVINVACMATVRWQSID